MADGDKAYVVELIKSRKVTRRGLALLLCETDKNIDAKPVVENLNPKAKQQVRTGFDHWLEGRRNKKRFHGWDEPGYRHCFVFKWKEGPQNHRLYGFLDHPLLGFPKFQLCVLVSHATKNRHKTDLRELKRANELRINNAVKEAITEAMESLNLDDTR
jgi:hypothetical protein